MSQKPTKNSKSLVKKLKEGIKTLEIAKEYWYNNWKQAQAEVEKHIEVIKTFKDLRNEAIGARTDALERENDRLQEIIRWLIKPSTTERKRPEDLLSPRSPRFRGDGRF